MNKDVKQTIERIRRRRQVRPKARKETAAPAPCVMSTASDLDKTNEIAIVTDEDGAILTVVANHAVEVYGICDYTPDDRVYRFSTMKLRRGLKGVVKLEPGTVAIGDHVVEEIIGDSPIGHADDGVMP